MEKAAKAVRRSSVKLLSLGGGHGDLNMVISEQKDVKNTAKAFMAAQNSAAQYMMKWASGEENRAVQDVSSQMLELNLLWTEVQREFTEHLKEFKQMFELILEGEKHVDQAKNHLAVCEQREYRIKKELKKAAKKATTDEIRALEKRLMQAERQKDLAVLEVEDKKRENEAIKLMRVKEGLLSLSDAYVELGRKCAIIHEAQRDITHQLPDVHEKDLEDIKYTGSGATKHYVMQAKERMRQMKRQRHQHADSEPMPAIDDLPPPYTPGDFYDQHPSQPALRPPHHHTSHSSLPQMPLDIYQPQFQALTVEMPPMDTETPPHLPLPPHPLTEPIPGQLLRPLQPVPLVRDDVNWGSEDELELDDLSGAMGGLNL